MQTPHKPPSSKKAPSENPAEEDARPECRCRHLHRVKENKNAQLQLRPAVLARDPGIWPDIQDSIEMPMIMVTIPNEDLIQDSPVTRPRYPHANDGEHPNQPPVLACPRQTLPAEPNLPQLPARHSRHDTPTPATAKGLRGDGEKDDRMVTPPNPRKER